MSASADLAARRFSVVIVNYNGGQMLLDCVRSVRSGLLPADRIIVVDNGSRDDSMARLEAAEPGCVILRNGCNAGFARAVNRGLAQVRSEFALLLNNDARLAPDAAALYKQAELIIKVKEPVGPELGLLRREHLLFSYLHLAANLPLLQRLREIGLTAVAFETVEDAAGRTPRGSVERWDATHFLVLEYPDRILDTLRRFAAEVG